MPFVSKPDRFSSDAIVPGRVTDPNGFITENTVIEGIHGPIILYFSVSGLRQLADRYKQIGLVPRKALELVKEEFDELEEEYNEAIRERDEAKAKLDRISGLQRDGFRVARVQGRPPKKEVAA